MTNARGKPQQARLADMSIVPDDRYTEPPIEECETILDQPLGIMDGFEIYAVIRTHLGVTCFFSLQLSVLEHGGTFAPMCRIDSKHGEVHAHHFLADGTYDPRKPREVIEKVPVDNHGPFLDNAYQEAFDRLVFKASSLGGGEDDD